MSDFDMELLTNPRGQKTKTDNRDKTVGQAFHFCLNVSLFILNVSL